MTRNFRRAVVTLITAVSACLNIQAQPSSETVFAMTNAANRNEVIAYSQVPGGRFFEVRRYATGGRGSGGTTDPLQSQGSLTLSTDHRLLFAANAGSGTVSVFRVQGPSLFLADQVPSGGSEPLAIAQYGNLVYVLNSAGSGSIVGFRLGSDGRLQQIDNSTTYLTASNSGGSSLSISPNGTVLAVTERIPNHIDTFGIHPDGSLAPIVVNTSTAPGVFDAAFAPDGKLIVSETGPAGGVDESAISSYSVLADGTLSAVSQSVPTLGNANCWNAIAPNGKWVYVSNAASSTISGFAIGQSGALTAIDGTVVATNPQGSANLDIAVSGDSKYVFTLNSGSGTISVFAIQSDGALTSVDEIDGLPKSAGFNGIAAL
ncbi:MAG TPA: beta-propeller fold lactonase family protein [Acidobacteriaceae bacterium]|jgi:6-phosphogluconolactonase (cycloisomerase 2 family)|nr:beta-propeller fold lactonase family protein [Acidobacteriaceae bacterium]